jgi:outer membrane protein assembly factor BamB
VAQGGRYFLFNEQGDLLIARLTPERYEEVSRVRLLEPNNHDARRPVVWSHPAFANRNIYARNDAEIVCASLAAE